jgi:hypothetical protein
MDFSQFIFCGVFEFPLPIFSASYAQKHVFFLIKEKSRQVGGWVWDLANARRARRFVFAGPLKERDGP